MKIIHQVTPEMVYDLFVKLNKEYYIPHDKLFFDKHIKLWLIYNKYKFTGSKSHFGEKNIKKSNLKQFYIELLNL